MPNVLPAVVGRLSAAAGADADIDCSESVVFCAAAGDTPSECSSESMGLLSASVESSPWPCALSTCVDVAVAVAVAVAVVGRACACDCNGVCICDGGCAAATSGI